MKIKSISEMMCRASLYIELNGVCYITESPYTFITIYSLCYIFYANSLCQYILPCLVVYTSVMKELLMEQKFVLRSGTA